jgi:ribokinase
MDKLNPAVEVSFTPGSLYAARGIEALTPILKRTYLLFINQNELRQLTGQDIAGGAEIFLQKGCRVVVVTLGKGASLKLCKANGIKETVATSYIRGADNEYAIQPAGENMTSEIDTTGAGDAFATGFIYGLLKEKNLEVCGRLGDLVARFSIAKTGARQSLLTLNELAKRYREIYSEQL